MAYEEPWAPLQDIPVPRDVADAVDMLMVVLIWLDANGQRYAAINVSDAIEKLTSMESS